MNGDQFACILDGVVKMFDFKALVIRMNSLNSLAIEKFRPLLHRCIPYHIEELQIVDCKMNSTLIEQLMDSLMATSFLKKFALVNSNHSERSFDKVIQFVRKSPYLRDLDLSWSSVRP